MNNKVFVRVWPWLFYIMAIYSCSIGTSDIVGVYSAKNLVKNIDTLKILSNGTYIKNLYRKKDNSLIYSNTGKWRYKEGRILLYNFLLDEDDVYSKSYNFPSILMTSSLIVERKSGRIIIYYRSDTEESYYEKQ